MFSMQSHVATSNFIWIRCITLRTLDHNSFNKTVLLQNNFIEAHKITGVSSYTIHVSNCEPTVIDVTFNLEPNCLQLCHYAAWNGYY
jgi:hypothetical protein